MHWKSLGLAECLGSLEVNPTCTSTCLCQFVFGCKEAERDRWEIRLGFGHFARGTAGLRVGLGRPWTRRGADASKHLETTSTPSALVLGPVEVGTVGVDQVGKEILAPPHSGPLRVALGNAPGWPEPIPRTPEADASSTAGPHNLEARDHHGPAGQERLRDKGQTSNS